MLTCQKDLFSIPPDAHYLNCAYMGPLSRRVEDAGIAGIRRKRMPAGLSPDDFFRDSDEVRGAFARLIHTPDPRRVAIVPAVSYAIATVTRNLPGNPAAGSNVVVADAQFPSNVHAWRAYCGRSGAELRTVGPGEPGEAGRAGAPASSGSGGPAARGASWNTRLLEAIDDHTLVVALGHVHWTDGTRFDLEAIGRRARECGALLVVDGTQSIGAMPFDVERIRPDVVVCAAYKWLLGPYSIGAAYFGPAFDDAAPIEETWIGRAGSEDFRGLVRYRDDYQPGAARFDVGERSNFILVPMFLEALRQTLEWGVEDIEAYCSGLTTQLVEGARHAGWTAEEGASRSGHLVGLRAPAGVDLEELQPRLQQRGVHVSLRGEVLRVAPHVYNDERDVAALLEALD